MEQATLQTLFKMTIALGAVLLVFGAVVLLLKRFSGINPLTKSKVTRGKAKPIEVLSFQNLGPGKNLYLVKCQGRKILIGATQQNISMLADMNDEFEDEAFQSSLEERVADGQETKMKSKFSSQLKEISRV